MHKSLEEYLNAVAQSLGALPKARREEELREMREHLLMAVAACQEAGQSEEDAAANALAQFGAAQSVAKSVVFAWQREVWNRWRSAPPEVLLFAVFSVILTVLDESLIFAGPKLWREAAYPYIGGSLAAPYTFSLIFACQSIFVPGANPKAHLAAIMPLLMYAAFGTEEYLRVSHLPNFHNPYLTASPWQPLWTVALPLAWAIVLGVCPIVRSRKLRQRTV